MLTNFDPNCNATKLQHAATMYGTDSKQYRKALKKYGSPVAQLEDATRKLNQTTDALLKLAATR